MAYELDFIGVPDTKKDADAIGIHWRDADGTNIVGVYDGGFEEQGTALVEHIKKYYSPRRDENKTPILDFVICSHSDSDHTYGLRTVLENFKVRKLYMNRPWLYTNELISYVGDGRKTPESLERELKSEFSILAELEDIAKKKNPAVKILPAFQGCEIEGKLLVLSPTKDFYIQKIIDSKKTKSLHESTEFSEGVAPEEYLKDTETWEDGLLREDVTVSAENEQSVVLLGLMEEGKFLLTGDAGKEALSNAIAFAQKQGYILKNCVDMYQVPHHGGRHNICKSVMEKLVGPVVAKEATNGKIACVSVAKGSDHPRQMVVNEFLRRDVSVYKTDGGTLHYNKGFSDRGWTGAKKLPFKTKVEPWKNKE